MTVFLLPPRVPNRITGTIQNYSVKVANGVFVTCADRKIVDSIGDFLMKNKVKFKTVNKSKHGIIPEIVVFD